MAIKRFSKIVFLLLSFLYIFLGCESTPTQPKRDIEYNIDKVRILLPREFQKVSSKQEIAEKFFPNQKIENLSPINQTLYDALTRLNNNQQHWFVKFDNDQLEFITLKTDGPPLRPSPDNTSRILELYEDNLNKEYMTPDSTYRHVLIEDKIKGAHMVQFFKFKYFHNKEGNEWFTTNYLIYSNSRTIGLSIYSQKKKYNDLENYMQFIQIDKK